jgi:hypothetical protein
MADGKSTPGQSVVSRLAARGSRAPLSRRAMPGGGEVWEGPLATRALAALGARAMTVDNQIIVGDDFDPSTPESQALYAHERYHQQVSGGAGSHHAHDAEEQAARAVESMVLHRAATGGTESGAALSGDDIRDLPTAPGSPAAPGEGEAERNPDPAAGYQALLAQGFTHQDIIEKLASAAMEASEQQQRLGFDRAADVKGQF